MDSINFLTLARAVRFLLRHQDTADLSIFRSKPQTGSILKELSVNISGLLIKNKTDYDLKTKQLKHSEMQVSTYKPD